MDAVAEGAAVSESPKQCDKDGEDAATKLAIALGETPESLMESSLCEIANISPLSTVSTQEIATNALKAAAAIRSARSHVAEKCPTCGGTGNMPQDAACEPKPCLTCGGCGKVVPFGNRQIRADYAPSTTPQRRCLRYDKVGTPLQVCGNDGDWCLSEDVEALEQELADAKDDCLRLHREKMDALFGPDGMPRTAVSATRHKESECYGECADHRAHHDMERDAARYRRARDSSAWYDDFGRKLWGEELDAAIDAALHRADGSAQT